MAQGSQRAVVRAIDKMHTNLGDQLTLDDLAEAAMFSRFYFCRIFQQITGIPPGRFLSALRLMEAKRLLVDSSLSVTEISHRVGYTSVGTFSTRFKTLVGESPSFYRELGGHSRIGIPAIGSIRPRTSGSIRGVLDDPGDSRYTPIFIGLFPEPIPQGRPAACTALCHPGPYQITDVPAGTWYLMAYAVSATHGTPPLGQGEPSTVVASPHCLHSGPANLRHVVDLSLRRQEATDPPILLGLPDTRPSAQHNPEPGHRQLIRLDTRRTSA